MSEKELEKKDSFVEIKGVSFSYGDNLVLDDISFEITKGDYLGIVGPNGSGKTTLLKIILGLLKPSKGGVKLFGKNIKDFKNWRRIGYVPQKVTNFDSNFPVTVEEVVLMGRYPARGLFHSTNKYDDRVVRESLEQVDMWKYKDRLIGDLSGGQQQRVFIARALATKPEIIFLDEPTTGVDQKAEDEFYSLLKKLNQELHLTLVLVSHDIDMVVREAKHIACMNRELVCYGTPEEFRKDNMSTELFGRGVKIITHKHNH